MVHMENFDPVVRDPVEEFVGILDERHHADAGALFDFFALCGQLPMRLSIARKRR
jgi:hypothetical protein